MFPRIVMILAGLALAAPVLAEPLVTKEGEAFKPGVVESWAEIDETSMRVKVREGAPVDQVVAALKEKLSGVEVSEIEGSMFKVSGVKTTELLAAMATIEVEAPAASDDPFAALGGLGPGAVALAAPTSGSSIRARKRSNLVDLQRKTDPRNFLAKVTGVTEGEAFGDVTLSLAILKPPTEEGAVKLLADARSIKAVPELKRTEAGVDLSDEANQINLAALYLRQGDLVYARVKPTEQKGCYLLEYVERK